MSQGVVAERSLNSKEQNDLDKMDDDEDEEEKSQNHLELTIGR